MLDSAQMLYKSTYVSAIQKLYVYKMKTAFYTSYFATHVSYFKYLSNICFDWFFLMQWRCVCVYNVHWIKWRTEEKKKKKRAKSNNLQWFCIDVCVSLSFNITYARLLFLFLLLAWKYIFCKHSWVAIIIIIICKCILFSALVRRKNSVIICVASIWEWNVKKADKL